MERNEEEILINLPQQLTLERAIAVGFAREAFDALSGKEIYGLKRRDLGVGYIYERNGDTLKKISRFNLNCVKTTKQEYGMTVSEEI